MVTKIIVGLGNPGEKYVKNRHNVGFMFVDWYLARQGTSSMFKFDKYTNAEIVEFERQNEPLILAKPQTFMNNSGSAVAKLVSDYPSASLRAGKLLITNDLIIIHDDLDIPLGKFKIQKGKGPELHYGVNSIESHLKNKDFWRVRIGVDNRGVDNRASGEVYTLQNFNQEELQTLQTVFEEASEAMFKLLTA